MQITNVNDRHKYLHTYVIHLPVPYNYYLLTFSKNHDNSEKNESGITNEPAPYVES